MSRDASRPNASATRSSRGRVAVGRGVSAESRRLRLIPGPPPSELTTLVSGVEEAFSFKQAVLLERLEDLEGAISGHGVAAEGALEQTAFLRVGLRCLTDAIGELAVQVEGLDRAPAHPSRSGPPTPRPA